MNDLLKELRNNRIKIQVQNGDLRLKLPKGFSNKQLLEKIRANKENLISHISGFNSKNRFQEIPKVPEQGYYVLSSAQQRMYF
uniref:TubC N-terminal docking domain-related protein n=1 Tax=Ascidiimonas meishanensis TaxID=3128903 RepID=UPI0030EC3193